MPPEFMKDGIISKEFDIFSFGVVIIEIVTGHKDYADMEFSEFVEHVGKLIFSFGDGCL